MKKTLFWVLSFLSWRRHKSGDAPQKAELDYASNQVVTGGRN
jgi:hypothetical protein